MRVYAPSTRAVRYTGEFKQPVSFVRYYHGEKPVTVEEGDILVLPAPIALKVGNKRHWELLTHEESEALLNSGDNGELNPERSAEANPTPATDADGTDDEAPKGDDGVSGDGESIADAERSAEANPPPYPVPEAVEITKENITDEELVSLKDIKKLCKKKKIRYGGLKRDEMIALLMPHL